MNKPEWTLTIQELTSAVGYLTLSQEFERQLRNVELSTQKKLLECLIADCKRMIELGDAITDVAKSIYREQVVWFGSMLKQLEKGQ